MTSARDWTPEQRALFLDREKEAREWLEIRKEEIKTLLAENPQAVPGYALKPGRAIETITDCQEVWRRFSSELGGKLESFMKCLRVGKAALQEEVRALSGHQGRELQNDVEALLSGCTQSKPSAPTIETLK